MVGGLGSSLLSPPLYFFLLAQLLNSPSNCPFIYCGQIFSSKGDEHISCYTYNTHQAEHYFCSTCGVHPFYQPRSNPKGRGISLQCLDEEETRKKAEIVPCDAEDWRNWEKYLDEHPKARNLTENVE